MRGMRKEEGRIERLISYLRGRGEVSALYVFGSRRSGNAGQSRPSVGVLVDESLLERENVTCARKGCFTLFSGSGEVVVLNDAAPLLKYQAVRRGSVIFERDMGHRVRFTERAVTEFFDHYRPAGDVSLDGLSDDAEGEFQADMEPVE
jgi:hypothetical protein